MTHPLVLAIHSDVVYGHVGLGAARPVSSAQGIGLLGIPTVLLAHHPGHRRPDDAAARPRGHRTTADEMIALVRGLADLGVLAQVSAVTTGYFADADQVDAALEIVGMVKACAPAAPFWCDPVLGDMPKGLYVPRSVADAIGAKLVPYADVLLPNAFEAHFLTGCKVDDFAGGAAAAAAFGTREVVITSVPDGPDRLGALWRGPDQVEFAAAPQTVSVPGGLGDCFAAYLLARRLNGDGRGPALQRAVRLISDLLALPRAANRPAELPLHSAARLLSVGTEP